MIRSIRFTRMVTMTDQIVSHLQRLQFNDVAERMGRSRPAVQMLWMRAIKKLQEVMGEEG